MLDRINLWTLASAMALAGRVESFRKREEGQTMAEYAVILAVITAAIIATLVLLSGNIDTVLNRVADAIK
jgi:Flp pilus assembly pilin Flp